MIQGQGQRMFRKWCHQQRC